MSAKQERMAAAMMGRLVRHYTCRYGWVIGVMLGKKGKGLWLQVSDGTKVWCQYVRCA